MASDLKEICTGLPDCFEHYLKYCRELKFTEDPDYSYMKQFFKNCARDQDIELDDVYDWS